MDKGTGKEQTKDEINPENWAFPESVLLDAKRLKASQEIWKKLDQDATERLAVIDKAEKSFFVDKTHFDLVKWLIIEETNRLKSDVSIALGIAQINERLETIENTLQDVGKKVNLEMPDLKSQIESLRENIGKPINRINDYLTEQQNMREKQRKIEDDLLDWATRSH